MGRCWRAKNHRDHFLLFRHKMTEERKAKEFVMGMSKNMGFILVGIEPIGENMYNERCLQTVPYHH